MIEAVKYNLRNLTNFQGRNARSTFWWYVLFLFIVQFILGLFGSAPMMIDMFGSAFEAAQAGANPEQVQAEMINGMTDSLRSQMWLGLVTGTAVLILFIASFTRRLHDSGKSGWIAIVVAALFIGGLLLNLMNLDAMIEMMRESMVATDPGAAMASQQQMMAYGFPTWIAYLLVIIFGAFDSQDGPNKYGDKPPVS